MDSNSSRFSLLAVAFLIALSGCYCEENDEVKDVIEGEDVVLQCRFSASLSANDGTLYWIRSSSNQHDNVAIGDTPYSLGYTVDYQPGQGRYDLRIRNATYDRDNGNFECRKVESGSGNKLHSSIIQLVVLLPPSPPSLSPVNPTVTEGKEFNLTCSSVGGSPPPQISWYKDGAAEPLEALYIPGLSRSEPSRAVLPIVPKKEDDSSSYKCTVWNRAIPATRIMEASTSINVNYYPRVTVGPENPIRVERDETAELICEVDAKPGVAQVKWVRENRFVQQNFRHVIPRANLKDNGSYICNADNGLGQTGTAEVILDVLYGPEVSVPEKKEVEDGQDVVVNCKVSANPPATSIIWTKEDDPEFKQIGRQLRLSGSDPAAVNNGRYTCSATNTIQPTGRQRKELQGAASITVAVKHAPGKTRISPENPTALEGKPISLTCGAKPPGYPQPTYRWWKEGSENTILASGSKFTIDSASLSSEGKYFCQPSNQFGTGSVAEISLNVYQEPKIVTPLQPTVIKRSGDTGYHVTCVAVAKPRPRVRWFKDGVEIDSTSDLYQESVSAQETISNEAFNVVSNLKFVGPARIGDDHTMPTDRGHYTCQFENEVAKTESSMLLRIEHSPVVRHLHNKVAADPGETAYIACEMQAFPSLNIEWSMGNSLLTDNAMFKTNVTELKDDIYRGLLKIERVEESHYGEYYCKASNAMGVKRTLINLQPKGKPEQPSNVRAVYKGYDTITLTWEEGFNGGYEETTYNVEYKEFGGGSIKHADCGWKNPCNITRLQQHTAYQFKVRAVNIRGDSEWSRDIKITTAVDVNEIPVPENLFYETSTKSVSFNVVNYPLGLFAKIELQNNDGSYRPHAQLGMDDLPYGQMEINEQVSGLRVKLCVKIVTEDQELCGQYVEAEIVEVRERGLFSGSVGSIPQGAVIAIAIIVAIIAIAGFVIVVKCCFCKQPKPKKLTKEDIAGPNRVPANHNTFNYGLDNKGVDTAKDADSPDIIKSQMYGYNYPSVPGAQVPNTYDQSSSNSNNGGSVNSQDSLWNVKHPNGEVIGANGYVSAGYYGEAQYPHGYQPQQPVHQQYDDYTHYPHPEEYLNERNRAYFAAHNGDRYAVPSKPRQRLESDYSPYGDVSGLPDPYTGHDISDELLRQQGHMDGHSNTGISLQSHDTADLAHHHEGYSTPSRRVIREIIV